MSRFLLYKLFTGSVVLVLFVTACSSNFNNSQNNDEKLKIVVTTTFVGDVVENIAGDAVDLTILLDPGQNPHSYQTTPQDLVKTSEADLIFVNGLGLEEFLDDLLIGSDAIAPVIVVSDGISTLNLNDLEHDIEGDNSDPDHNGVDPHVWFDPNNVIIWTDNITRALIEKDPSREAVYKSNAIAYRNELSGLDSWIQDQLDQIPPENQKLVTDHIAFSYFTERYGIELIGTVIPAMTTEAETSGQQLADLMDIIRENKVKAIFVGVDFDPALSHRVAEDSNIELVKLYFGSLSEGNPAGTYLDFMRYNVDLIVKALK